MAWRKMRHLADPVGMGTGKAVYEHDGRRAVAGDDVVDKCHFPSLIAAFAGKLPVRTRNCCDLALLASLAGNNQVLAHPPAACSIIRPKQMPKRQKGATHESRRRHR